MQRCPHHPKPPIEFAGNLAPRLSSGSLEAEDFLYDPGNLHGLRCVLLRNQLRMDW
jgi:hypothetical protein